MIAKAIDKIQELADVAKDPKFVAFKNRPSGYMYDGRFFEDEEKDVALPQMFEVHTLGALAEILKNKIDRKFMSGVVVLHVKDEKTVGLSSEARGPQNKRALHAGASPLPFEEFDFGRFMPVDEFMIQIQSKFVQHVGSWDDVVASCAGIKKQDGVEYKDSGVSQTVAVQHGLSLMQTKKLPNPVSLAPFRTFQDIEQPVSEFVLRVSEDRNGSPQIALFEADGGAWKMKAIESIKSYLQNAVDELDEDLTISIIG